MIIFIWKNGKNFKIFLPLQLYTAKVPIVSGENFSAPDLTGSGSATLPLIIRHSVMFVVTVHRACHKLLEPVAVPMQRNWTVKLLSPFFRGCWTQLRVICWSVLNYLLINLWNAAVQIYIARVNCMYTVSYVSKIQLLSIRKSI